MILASPVRSFPTVFLFMEFLDFLYLLSSDESYSILLLYLFHLISSDESDSIDDESDNDWSDSGSSGTCYFTNFLCVLTIPLVVLVVWGLYFFVPTGVESKCGILKLSCVYQKESNTKAVESSKHFGAQIPCSLSKF